MKQKLEIEADEITFPGRGIIHLRGSTQLVRGKQRVYADQLIYNKSTQTVEFRGSVRIEFTDGDVVHTSLLFYDLERETATSGAAEFMLRDRDTGKGESDPLDIACGSAERIQFTGGTISHMKGARIVTCEG